ncbi:MAG: oligosaccharide flippase family protein [Rhodobacteraceae bacterium]|nr:oligosaccharide flippase family protein [Paracoccaceae bacterium]
MRWLHGRIARGSVATLAIRLTALGLGFLQTLILARLLGADSYGQVVSVVSIATLAAWIGVLGLNSLAVREIARFRLRGDAAAENGFLRFALFAVAAFASFAGLAAWALAAPSLPGIGRWILVLTPMIAVILFFRGASLGQGRVIASQAPLDVLRPALFLSAVTIVTISGSLGAPTAIALNTAAFAAAMIAALLLGRPSGAEVPSTLPSGAGLLKSALPFYLGGVFASLQSEMMVLMLTVLSTPEQTGLFQIAFRLSTLLLVVRLAIDVPLGPRFSASWERGEREDVERLASLSAATSTVSALLIWFALFLLGRPLISLFGPDFVAAQDSLMVLAAAQILFVSAGPLPVLLNMADRSGVVTWALAGAQVVQVLFGLFLVPDMGALGAALAMSAAIAAWTLTMWLATRLSLGLKVSPLHGLLIYARRGLR